MGDSHSSRGISIYNALGAGPVADVLLWKKRYGGVVLLVSSTTLWFLFELGGYNFLSFVANVLFLLVVILFLWAKSASLLNRPLPPLPDLEISDDTVVKVANALRVWVNRALSIAREIAIGRNLRIFAQVAIVLTVISYMGSLCNLLTLIYLGILLSLSVPVLYAKYEDRINEKLWRVNRFVRVKYHNINLIFTKKIPLGEVKQKKSE